MTQAQHKRFYLPAWNRAFAANWRRDRGTVARLDGRESTELLTAVETAAVARAVRRFGRVVADDLRHACHEVALRRDKSSLDLTTGEANRVVALFDLLADPLDLKARVRWECPERAEEESLRAALRRFPVAYVVQVCRDKFGTRYWEQLRLPELRMLHVTLRERFKQRRREDAKAEPNQEGRKA
jgi:class 3 adenylate cyclase